jgi:MerR family copper efflux transcriptional regulator
VPDGLIQIGEVADRTGLSLRTIRYYEEVGLVVPSGRSQGRFRLYSPADVERLQLVKHMKPLDFSLDEMRDLLRVLDELAAEPDERTLAGLLERLAMFRAAADARVEILRGQLAVADSFADRLRRELSRGRRRVAERRR